MEYQTSYLIFTVIASSLIFAVFWVSKEPTFKKYPGYPIFGNLFELLSFASKFEIDQFFANVANLDPLCMVTVFFQNTLVVSDASITREIISKPSTYYRDDFLRNLFTGSASSALFLIPHGAAWRRHRKLLQPSFNPSNFQHGFAQVVKCTRAIFSKWETDGLKTCEMYHQISSLTSDVIFLFAFGYEMGFIKSSGNGVHRVKREFSKIMEIAGLLISHSRQTRCSKTVVAIHWSWK